MSTVLPTPEGDSPNTSPAALPASSQRPRSQRVLACLLCQQRKVRCDRKFPCANCIKSRVQCVPSTLVPRQRKRRFPERELLERLRQYEDLLQQNHVKFEPLYKDATRKKEFPAPDDSYDPEDGHPETVSAEADHSSPSTPIKSERIYEAKYVRPSGEILELTNSIRNFWDAMNQRVRDPESDSDSDSNDSYSEVRKHIVRKAWDQSFQNDDHLLFGSRNTAVDLSTLHPEPVQIFRLWQIYLDNVDRLLKVTHVPSLQVRVIEAASNIKDIKPTMEALLYSIYCMAVLSLSVDDCQSMFGSLKQDLLTRYQFGCQQALLNCGFLRTSDRDCLTALYFYLVSIRPGTDPRSLSSLLSIAARIAMRMGINNEADNEKCSPFEAEMRRRLWWSLVLFETRISEMADNQNVLLAPTWDCKIPLNVNDSDLRPEMKEPPSIQANITESIFSVVRSELGNYVRHSMFYLDFTNPALRPLVRERQNDIIPEDGELVALNKMIEEKYFQFCDPEIPFHFMTIWTARAYLAKCRLLENYSRFSSSPARTNDTQRNTALALAFSMLDCDTKLLTSPLTKGYLWQAHFHFPFVAYVHISQDVRRRPLGELAERAWDMMNQNYDARIHFQAKEGPIFKMFTKIILQAWEPREAAFRQSGMSLTTPRMVTYIRNVLEELKKDSDARTSSSPDMDSFSMSLPVGSHGYNLLFGMEVQDDFAAAGSAPGMFNVIPEQPQTAIDMNQFNWAAMDWNSGGSGGW